MAREGFHLIAAGLVLTGLCCLLGWSRTAAVAGIATALVAGFFRDPERAVPVHPDHILAPADGRVITVATVHDPRFLRGEARLVSIFMSPLDVHVNRVPVAGRVVDVRYHPGRHFRAFADKASLDNEQLAVVLEDPAGRRLCVVQIAGFLARRIVCHLGPGDRVAQGQRYGLIMFGSRADLYLPPDARVLVQAGARARAGQTVVAEWPA